MKFAIVFMILIYYNVFKIAISHSETTKLLVISFDGFRWDYIKMAKEAKKLTPNFDLLITSGVYMKEDGVHNLFITKTFPNHYSLATGLYEESHGIVANLFYDPVYNEVFDDSKNSSNQYKWWNGTTGEKVEPVWKTNEVYSSEHSPRASGVYFWPGVNVKENRPTYFKAFLPNSSFVDGINSVIGWFSTEENPINFGMIYFPEPDMTGHKYGPTSKEMFEKIVELDELVGVLLNKLIEAKIRHSINIIITSDHGMTEIKETIFLDDYVDSSLYKVYSTSPVLHIKPNEGMEDLVLEHLKKCDKLNVYKKMEIPSHYHYSNSRRIMPLLISAFDNVNICFNKTNCSLIKGNHGYDNELKSMHPFFIASGPMFKSNYSSKPFNLTDIYPLMCHILDITPRNNNGSFDNIKHILLSFGDEHNGEFLQFTSTNLTYILVFGFVLFFAMVIIIGSINSYCSLKYVGYTRALQDAHKPLMNQDFNEEEEEELV